jgi:SNF2 family DNA or RNA helicase
MLRPPLPGQVPALKYAAEITHPALFMAMRTGKCLPTIRTILTYTPRNPLLGLRVLIVAPKSAIPGWLEELDYEEQTSAVILRGSREKRLELLQSGVEWYILNREGWHVLPEIARRDWMEWDAVVIDESTMIKSPHSGITHFFLSNFRDVPHRWILTGVPCPESLLDVWCQMAFLDRRPLGRSSYYSFRNKCFQGDARGYKWIPSKGTDQLVVDYLAERAFVLRKEGAGMEKHEIHEREYVLENEGQVIRKTVFSGKRWQWMQQLCGGFLDHELVWPDKIKELVYLLRTELSGEQVVVWFNYNQELYACAKEIALTLGGSVAKVFVGKTPDHLRGPLVKDFNRGRFRVLLVQEAVAEYGVDMSGGDTQLFYSNWPGLLRRVECKARLEHPKRKSSFLTIDFCTADTANEDIALALADKNFNSEVVLARVVWERMRRRVRCQQQARTG